MAPADPVFFFHNVSVHTKRISQQTCDLKILTVVIIFILYCLCRSKIPIKIKELAYFHLQEVKIIMFSLLFIFQISEFVVSFNCTSPTPVALFDELDKDLFSKKLIRPVKSFSNPLNISISITVVGILGVVSLHSSHTRY